MNRFIAVFCLGLLLLAPGALYAQNSNDWVKDAANPVLGGNLGVCFDVALLQEDGVFKMWFSWRTKESIGYAESKDGVKWSDPVVVLGPRDSGWEMRVNRCSVVHKDGVYYMWYTGQTQNQSFLGMATSADGVHWERQADEPVMRPEMEWEKTSVMCPDVRWNEETKLFEMRYSAGEQNEPNAIGYATSADGLVWAKYDQNPIFAANPDLAWEQHKVTACQIVQRDGWFYMFYIGFENENLARIGIARSRDGISGWERLKANPIVSPDKDRWDADACYKPFAIYDEKDDVWRLWYNGRKGGVEQIGLVWHKGADLGFGK